MLKPYRELAPIELFFYWRNVDRYYSNFSVGAEYSQELDTETVFKALNYMCYKYSSLASNVYDFGIKDKAGFTGRMQLMDKFKLKDVLTIIEDPKENCETQMDKVHKYYFDYAGTEPLWKVILINKKQLLFYCDHLPFDGNSAFNFHRVFGEALRVVRNTQTADEYIGMESILYDSSKINGDWFLQPSPFFVLDSKVPFKRYVYELILALMPHWISKRVRYFFGGNPYKKIMHYDSRSLPPPGADKSAWLHIPTEKLDKLLKVCRQNNVRLTSLLYLVGMLAAKDILADYDNSFGVPYNMRSEVDQGKALSLCPNFHDDFGNFIGFNVFEFPSILEVCPDGKINWDVVRNIHKMIHDSKSRCLESANIFQIFDSRNYLKKISNAIKAGGVHISTMTMSNLGNISIENGSGDGLEIERVWFNQPVDKTMIWMNVCSAKKGLTISLRTYLPEWLDVYRVGVEEQLDVLIK
ncbi:N-acetyltransferase [Martiniozyma asiatica (nom. inval.)]|nr:N-acetyltransferase [Martiniozyma asiatica]